MSFSSPLLLLTLLVIPAALLAFLLAQRRRMRYSLRFTNLDVLAQVVGGRPWRRYVPPALFLIAIAALCVGFARPHVKTLIPRDRATVVLVIDASGSMQADDVFPTRLAAARAAVSKFLDRVPKRLRVGLVVFAGEPQTAAPPTTDRSLLRTSLDELGMFPGFGGTAIGDALAQAVQLGRQAIQGDARTLAAVGAAPETKGLVSILLLSDGKQNRGILQPLQGAARAKAAGIPVYTIALGTPNGTLTRTFGGIRRTIPVPPDPGTLQAIARSTGGEFFAARSANALQAAYSKLGSRLGRTPGTSEVTYAFLAGAAAVVVLAGLLSALWSPRLP